MIGRSVRGRITATTGLFGVIFAALAARAVQLTLLDGAELRRLAERQHRQRVAVPAKRGPIVDRFGEPLALTRESAAVYVRPGQLGAGPETLAAVARALELPAPVVSAKAASGAPFVWLDRQAPLERWAAVAALAVPGIGSEPSRVRSYPNGPLAGHVLGFTGIDGQGLEGVERMLDADLRGEVEALDVERDARGRKMMMGEAGWRPLPRVGARVELTIDAGLQHVVETELEGAVHAFQAEAGSAVVLAPFTGEVLAMANVPRFDPNEFTRAAAGQWRNRVITDAFEPGSTFKAVLAAAALEAGVIGPQNAIFCENGRYPVGRRVIHDHHGYGVLSFAQVIQRSSNIGCAKVAERLGRERLAAAIEQFGFGRPTGIDLPGEAAGLVRPVERWGRIHLVTAAFGHGIAVTSLQLARAYAAIANGGLLMRPYVVRRIVGERGLTRHMARPHVQARVMSPETAATLSAILRGVVETGTGTQAQIEGLSVAGKTGTAQKVDVATKRYAARARIASFVGYVPADAPRLVILVVVDSPQRATYGGVVAAPVFRRIAEYGLARYGARPRSAPLPAPWASEERLARPVAAPRAEGALDSEVVPSFLGLSKREALVHAQLGGWEVRLEGSGYVIAQDPPPGAPRDAGALRLGFGSMVH